MIQVAPFERSPIAQAAEPAERLGVLFRTHYARLFGLTYRLLGDRAEAEDVAQEAFVKLMGSPLLARPDDEVFAWLSRVALNGGTNRLRDRQRAQQRLERVGRLEVAASPEDPLRTAVRNEEQTTVRQALEGLPERQRQVLLLRHAGYSYAEIAATLDLALGSVGVLLARAEGAFRRRYQELQP